MNVNIFCKDSRLLEEYELLKEVLEITSISNISHASVKIVFRRRIEYHITKTFLQVFLKVDGCSFQVHLIKQIIF